MEHIPMTMWLCTVTLGLNNFNESIRFQILPPLCYFQRCLCCLHC